MRKSRLAGIAMLMVVVMACSVSLGGEKLSEEERLETAVAEALAEEEEDTPPEEEGEQPLPTITLAPTATEKGDPTATPKPCNKAKFISETIPDDTEYDAGDTFTKTWRLKNIGTCIWNTDYEVVFASGDKMDGPSTQKLPQAVAPNEQIDISVDLTAPAGEDTYKGFWKVADDEGDFFVNTLWVQIKVKPIPLTTYNVTLDVDLPEGGGIWENGDTYPGDYGAGDTFSNLGVQSLLSFDISGIPSDAVIKEVLVDFTGYVTLGNPFGGLGCLRLYPDPYRPFDSGDYTPPPVSNADVRWCSSVELSSKTLESKLADYLQSRLGKNYMPVRLQFNEKESDNDNANDLIGFTAISLDVKYKAP